MEDGSDVQPMAVAAFIGKEGASNTCGNKPQSLIHSHVISFELPDTHTFATVKRILLGRRCKNLKRIERAADAKLTLHGPYPCHVEVLGSSRASVEHAASLVTELLRSFAGLRLVPSYGGMIARPCDWKPPRLAADTEDYLTAKEMERMLVRLGCHNSVAVVADMLADGLPFAAEVRMPDFEPQAGEKDGSDSGCALVAPNVEESIGLAAQECQDDQYFLPGFGALRFPDTSHAQRYHRRYGSPESITTAGQSLAVSGRSCVEESTGTAAARRTQNHVPVNEGLPNSSRVAHSSIEFPALRSPLDQLD